MCGIVGSMGQSNRTWVEEALASMAHRGRDGIALIEGENFAIAQNRLAITAIDTTPLHTVEGISVVFNGEIYNYEALAQKLGITVESETQLIIEAYRAWGESFVKELDGMFAIALIDARNGVQGFLYRDRVGKKPLFYLPLEGVLSFASELGALAPLDGVRHDNIALAQYLSYETTLSPMTFYTKIQSLAPFSYLAWQEGKYRIERYGDWLPKSFTVHHHDVALDALDRALHEAIAKRIPREVPYVSLLSGGVDSALIAALLREHGELDTYTIGYEGWEKHDERPYAAQVAKVLGTHHHEVLFGYEEFLTSIDRALDALGAPHNDPAAVPLYALMEHIATTSNARVVFSGEGSDELFLGYRPHIEMLEIESLKHLSKKGWLSNYFTAHPVEHREWHWYSRIFNDEVLFRSSLESWSASSVKRLMRQSHPTYDDFATIAPYRARFEASGHRDDNLWYRYIDVQLHQGEYFLTKLDRMSMAHTLEARAPFMDTHLIESAFGIAPHLFVEGRRTKHLLKALAHRYLLRETVERKKRGFSYPYTQWMTRMGALESMRAWNGTHKLLKPQALEHAIAAFAKGQYKQHVFGLYVLLRWHATHEETL